MDWLRRQFGYWFRFDFVLGFNPCCDGLVAKTGASSDDPVSSGIVSILVVMDWLRRPVELQSMNHCCRSFNPCCDGLVAKTTRDLWYSLSKLSVSILVVMDWLRRHLEIVEPIGSNFVSILVVMDWLRRPNDVEAPKAESRFQSLLWWIGCEDLESSANMCGGMRVSILVVMDWLRRLNMSGMRHLTTCCFNPCCDGLVAKTVIWPRHKISHDVSILVVMDWLRRHPERHSHSHHSHRVSILVVMDWLRRPARCWIVVSR